MPFGTITSQTVNYMPRSPGVYSKDGLTFDQPADEFRLRAASSTGKVRSVTVTRVIQKDVTVNDSIERFSLSVSLQVQVPVIAGFTAAQMDSAALDISEFVTSDTISRMLQGEV